MKILFLLLVILFIVLFFSILLKNSQSHQRKDDFGTTNSTCTKRGSPIVCCGQHAACKKEALLKVINKDIEYYEDEELDIFRGRAADSYTPTEEEQFEEVLTTLHEDEILGWLHSLKLRGINLPITLRDEATILLK